MIDVTGLRATLGHTDIEASGRLKDPKGNSSFQFRTQLAIGELARLMKASVSANGTVVMNGNARLDASNNYDVAGNIEARNLSLRRVSSISATSISCRLCEWTRTRSI